MFHAPGIERRRLSPGAVEGLELVPRCVMGRVRLPVPPAAQEGFTAGPTLKRRTQKASFEEKMFSDHILHQKAVSGGGGLDFSLQTTLQPSKVKINRANI